MLYNSVPSTLSPRKAVLWLREHAAISTPSDTYNGLGHDKNSHCITAVIKEDGDVTLAITLNKFK
jgi:hypothetical protein